MKLLTLAIGLVLSAISALGQPLILTPLTPQGRLTLQSNTPVMTSDVTGATTVYYTPYVGNALSLPYLGGGGPIIETSTFSQLTLTLNSTYQTSGNIYDVFAFYSGGSIGWFICTGPAWTSSTSRGTGAGTTELTQLDGIWVNANTIEHCAQGSSNDNSFAAYGAAYLGSIYMTANGETGVSLKPAAASGGTGNIIGLYNAYNRVRVTAYSRDDTSNWTYGTASWRAADNSTSNRIYFLDGLQQSPVTGKYSVGASTTADTVGAYIGLNIDSSTTTPHIAATAASAASETSTSQSNVMEPFYPVLGFHYVQAVEYATGTSAQLFGVSSSQQVMALTVSLDM